MPHEELFSESEVVEVVRRAAELQEARSDKGYVPGLTRDELVRMATEAGIEPAYVQTALEDMRKIAVKDRPGRPEKEIERVLPVEVAPEEYDVITESVKVLPRTSTQYGTTGGLDTIGRTVRGQIASVWDSPHFAVTSRGGRTRLRVWSGTTTSTALPFLWMIPAVFTPLVGAFSNPVFGVLSLLGCIAGAWATFRWLKGKAHQASKAAADALEAAIYRAADETEARLAKERGDPNV